MKIALALAYTFAAWLALGFLVYAGQRLSGGWRILYHNGAVPLCFLPAFRFYFAHERSLRPAMTAGVSFVFVVALDVFLLSPNLNIVDFFGSFWDWQLPAGLMAGSIYGAGKRWRP